jgi:hypothetical protein
MQFYSYVLFQLDEARRHIEDGRPEHLRLSLLLLDNCAEMQMAEYIDGALARERMREKLQRSYRGVIPEDAPSPIVQEVYAFKPLTVKEKRGIDRNFEDKVHYMVSRARALDAALASPLLHLHRYRNEAYHRNSIRPPTLRTACLILFEINCEILLGVPRSHMSYSSDGDYTWLKECFGVERYMSSEQLQQIVISLRVTLIPDAADVSALLAEYLENRFADFFGQLRYIAENLQSITDEVGALAEAYSYRDSRVKFPDGEIPKSKLERQPIAWIREREQLISTVRKAGTRIEAFERFAVLERNLEPIETAVEDLVVEIDNYIDMQVDIMRGK